MTLPIVIDNVIPQLYQDEVEKLLLEKQPWYYQSDINFSDEHLKELDKKYGENNKTLLKLWAKFLNKKNKLENN